MAAKRGKGSGADDLAKFIAKLFKKQAPAKVRRELSMINLELPKSARPTSSLADKPKKAAAKVVAPMKKAPAKVRYELQKGLPPVSKRKVSDLADKPKKVAPAKARPISKGSNIKTTEPSIKTTKGPKSAPKRPQRNVPLNRGKGGLAKTDAEKRTAEREANRWLRSQKDLQPPKRPTGNVPVGDEIPRVKKRSKSGRKPPRSTYEGDQLRREAAEDRRNIGQGRPAPRRRKKK